MEQGHSRMTKSLDTYLASGNRHAEVIVPHSLRCARSGDEEDTAIIGHVHCLIRRCSECQGQGAAGEERGVGQGRENHLCGTEGCTWVVESVTQLAGH